MAMIWFPWLYKDMASEDVQEALFTAQDKEKELTMDNFVTERLVSISFYHLIQKVKSRPSTPCTSHPHHLCRKKKGNKKFIKADRKLFQWTVGKDAGREVASWPIKYHQFDRLSLAKPCFFTLSILSAKNCGCNLVHLMKRYTFQFIVFNFSQSMRHNLPSFHALTGCDSVSKFQGMSKQRHGKHLMV